MLSYNKYTFRENIALAIQQVLLKRSTMPNEKGILYCIQDLISLYEVPFNDIHNDTFMLDPVNTEKHNNLACTDAHLRDHYIT